jgi:hypothetical protein
LAFTRASKFGLTVANDRFAYNHIFTCYISHSVSGFVVRIKSLLIRLHSWDGLYKRANKVMLALLAFMYACAGTVFAISIYALVDVVRKPETTAFSDDSISVFLTIQSILTAVNVRLLNITELLMSKDSAEYSWRYYYTLAG